MSASDCAPSTSIEAILMDMSSGGDALRIIIGGCLPPCGLR